MAESCAKAHDWPESKRLLVMVRPDRRALRVSDRVRRVGMHGKSRYIIRGGEGEGSTLMRLFDTLQPLHAQKRDVVGARGRADVSVEVAVDRGEDLHGRGA